MRDWALREQNMRNWRENVAAKVLMYSANEVDISTWDWAGERERD